MGLVSPLSLIQILQTKHGGEWKIIQQELHYFNCFLDLTRVIITVPIERNDQ